MLSIIILKIFVKEKGFGTEKVNYGKIKYLYGGFVMGFVGVIAEYDPFHLGHAHHLKEARRLSGQDGVVVVMSGCFTQRGEGALLSPHVRARMALENGADAVILLPAMWSLRDAEHFALGGVSLLSDLGASALSFGAEDADLPRLLLLARAMEDPTPMMLAAIHSRLDAGMSYPSALQSAIALLLPEAAPLLDTPNNTLAVCYLRAMMRMNAPMDVIPVHRSGDYHAQETAGALSSATAVRAAIRRSDWEAVSHAVPASVLTALRSAADKDQLLPPDAFDQALLYRLRTVPAEDWHSLPGISEGIEDRLRKAAMQAASRDELLENAKTKRYPRARLNRLCSHALLQYDQSLLEDTPYPPAALLLGFRKETQHLLKSMTGSPAPLISKAAQLDRSAAWVQAEARAWDIWALGCGLPCGMLFTEKMVVI